MKLFYWKNPTGIRNFGDDLNELIWESLIPNLIDDNEAITLVPIGSVLNHWLPQRTANAKRRLIFSSGVGYGKPLVLDDSYKVYCVRGPLSAKSLGLSNDLAIADGAILIRNINTKILKENASAKLFKFSYMPHYKLASNDWNTICQDLGFGYIDPRWDVKKVLEKLNRTEVLLCEAMHGAIVADALRIPWVPIVSNPQILRFKWEDWCQSIGVEYKPNLVTYPFYRKPSKQDWLASARQLKCYVRNYHTRKKVSQELLYITKQAEPILSNVNLLDSLVCRLLEKLERLKADVISAFN